MSDRFSISPMSSIMEMFCSINDLDNKIENIPFIIVYHGRSDVNECLAGIKLGILPALYNIKERKIYGGTSLLNSDNSIPFELNNIEFFNACYGKDKMVFVLNYRAIFDGEFNNREASDEKLNIMIMNDDEYKVRENESFINYDIIDKNVYVSLPIYSYDEESVEAKIQRMYDAKKLLC